MTIVCWSECSNVKMTKVLKCCKNSNCEFLNADRGINGSGVEVGKGWGKGERKIGEVVVVGMRMRVGIGSGMKK